MPRRFPWPLALVIIAAVTAAIFYNKAVKSTVLQRDLPVRSTLTGDLAATERTGRIVRLSELRGKVVLCAYVYTVCPHGCAAVVGEMQKLFQRYGTRPDFHLVSIAVLPEHDTPAFLTSYADGLGLKPTDPWWFLTGNRQEIWDFMDKQLLLTPAVPIPAEERLNPLDTHEHDLRIVLIDKQSQIRGYYSVFHPQAEVAELMQERLEADTEALLAQPAP
ncbi:MAG: electron transport protein SCO1/SenC [Verrucomicrobiales bacterium]|nr:electron transport protein SCO1/SenC [Verrucomicrobiales bacterium]